MFSPRNGDVGFLWVSKGVYWVLLQILSVPLVKGAQFVNVVSACFDAVSASSLMSRAGTYYGRT